MPIRPCVLFLAISLLPMPMPASATKHDRIVIGALPDTQCANDNTSVYNAPKHPDDLTESGMCRLAFLPCSDTQDSEAVALMRIDGELIRPRRVDSVDMHATRSCPSGIEGCDYTGTLIVAAAGGRITLKIQYYRRG